MWLLVRITLPGERVLVGESAVAAGMELECAMGRCSDAFTRGRPSTLEVLLQSAAASAVLIWLYRR